MMLFENSRNDIKQPQGNLKLLSDSQFSDTHYDIMR